MRAARTALAALLLSLSVVVCAGWRARPFASARAAAAVPAPAATPQTFTVTNSNESGPGSLRQAILDANANLGARDTIAFNGGSGGLTINTALPDITDPVVIDGYTQPGAQANTAAVGSNAVTGFTLRAGFDYHGGALRLKTTNSIVRGLRITNYYNYAIWLDGGAGNRIEGNVLGLGLTESRTAVLLTGASGNVIGGTTLAARNLIAGNDDAIVITPSSPDGVPSTNNLIAGNYIGTDATGTQTYGNHRAITISGAGAASNTVGGLTTTPGAPPGNVIKGTDLGAGVRILGSGGNIVQGNLIEANFGGVYVSAADENMIGGRQTGAGNVIVSSGNAVELGGSTPTTGNTVQGNFIGVLADAVTARPNSRGVVVTSGRHLIGAPGVFDTGGNRIAFNGQTGVQLTGDATGARILTNLIYANGSDSGLDLDLADDRVTYNDAGDADTGPNNRQNFPVLTAATTGAAGASVTGRLNSTPNQTFTLEFFANHTCNRYGYGGGEIYLGPKVVNTDANGNVAFTFSTALSPADNLFVTATATNNTTGDTSEFSACAGNGIPPPAAISGQVRDASGAPLAGVTVSLSSAAGRATTTTSVSGNYSFPDLAAYTYAVGASLPGYAFDPPYADVRLNGARRVVNFVGTQGGTPPRSVVLISEFRLSGQTATDEFIELYNNTSAPLDIGGYTVLASNNNSAFRTITLRPDAVIPPHGHYLLTHATGYSLGAYAAGDSTYDLDLLPNDGLLLRGTSLATLDAVGFSNNTALNFREGAGLTPVDGSAGQYSFVRKLTDGGPQDTDSNRDDFVLVSTTGAAYGRTGAPGPDGPSVLGAPGPENSAGPVRRNAALKAALIEPQAAATDPPNRVRDTTPHNCNGGAGPSNCTFGTLSLRRRFVNRTGQPVTALRFRVVDITTQNSPGFTPGGAQADVRAINGPTLNVTTSRGPLTVLGTTVEQPAALAQPNGGGLNTTLTVAIPGGSLPNGEALDLHFLLGVQQEGGFRFFVNVEALPAPQSTPPTKLGAPPRGPKP